MENSIKISIIIPVVNEAPILAQAIERAWRAGADEVIVADGGSTDDSAKLAKSANCRLIVSKPGRGIQMNAGARAASGDYLLFLHADNWLGENTCSQIRNLAVNAPESFGGFKQTIGDSRNIFRWIEFGNEVRAKYQRLIYGDQGMFVSQELFWQVDGFPEIIIMEDFKISQRLGRLARPFLLPGPLHVDARRWNKKGPLKQTCRNWYLAMAFRCGATPEWIASRYRRHDK